jgi:aryl-alcohol dehydrogenase-like predicted oxidoreductase
MAEKKNCTPAQLALAWVLNRGEHVFPIPGTKNTKYLEENVGASEVNFSDSELKEIDRIAPLNAAAGLRYPEASMSSVNR